MPTAPYDTPRDYDPLFRDAIESLIDPCDYDDAWYVVRSWIDDEYDGEYDDGGDADDEDYQDRRREVVIAAVEFVNWVRARDGTWSP